MFTLFCSPAKSSVTRTPKKNRAKGRFLSRDNLPHSLFCSISFYFIRLYDPFELPSIATSKHCLFGQTTDVLKHQDEGVDETEAPPPDLKSSPLKFQGYLIWKMTQSQSLFAVTHNFSLTNLIYMVEGQKPQTIVRQGGTRRDKDQHQHLKSFEEQTTVK